METDNSDHEKPLMPMKPKASGGKNEINAKSTLYCIVTSNPYNLSPSATAPPTAEELFKDVKDEPNLLVPPEIPKNEPVVPLVYLGKCVRLDGTMLDGDDLQAISSSMSASFANAEASSPAATQEDVPDFVTYCKAKGMNEKEVFEDMVHRLIDAGFVIYPPEMIGEGGCVNPSGLWTSPDLDEIYVLIHIDEKELKRFAEKKQVQLQTNPFSYMGGAGAPFTVRSENLLRQSVLDFKETFEKQGNLPSDSDTVRWKPWGFRFHLPQRARMVERLLKDKYHGCGIAFDEMRRSNILIHHFFPVHNGVYMKQYKIPEWASFRQLITFQPLFQDLNGLVNYFGEKIAIYFHWIRQYTLFMLPIALIGFWVHVLGPWRGIHDSRQGWFAAAVVIWSALWVSYWRRQEHLFSFDYGMDIEAGQEIVRDEFEGNRAGLNDYDLFHTKFDYPLTMEVSHGGNLVRRVDKPFLRRFKRILLTYPAVIVSIGALLTCLYFLTKFRFDGNATEKSIANYVTVALMIVFGAIFGKVVDYLNDFENNRTDTEYENSWILKTFAFSFCNAYSALFIIALWPIGVQDNLMGEKITKYCNVTVQPVMRANWQNFSAYGIKSNTPWECNCSWTTYWRHVQSNGTWGYQDLNVVEADLGSQCAEKVYSWNNGLRLDQLYDQLFSILVIKPMVQNFQELFVARGMTEFRLYVDTHGGSTWEALKQLLPWLLTCGCLFKKKDSDDNETKIRNAEGRDVPISEIIAETRGRKLDLTDPLQGNSERRVILWRESQREPYGSTTGDFHEIVIQFGYMAMFAMIFPVGPLVCMLYNALEIRIDASKLYTSCQRTRPTVANSIGAWNTVFYFLVMASVMTNAFTICFLTDYVAEYYSNAKQWSVRIQAFIYVQYIFFAIVALVLMMRSSVPESILRALLKQGILKDRRINSMKVE